VNDRFLFRAKCKAIEEWRIGYLGLQPIYLNGEQGQSSPFDLETFMEVL